MSFWSKIVPVAVGAVLALGANTVSAATLTFYNDVNPNDTSRATFNCSLGCEGALFDSNDPLVANLTSWSGSLGDLVDNLTGAQASTDFVNRITGESYDKDADRTETSRAGFANVMFTSSAEYILFKIGKSPNVGLIKNTGGANNKFTFNQVGRGAGLSNTEEFGRVDDPPGGVIPVPAGLPLLISALGVFGIVRSRKRKSA